MLTIRIDETLEMKIDQLASTLGISKSELIRRSINQYISTVSKVDPWTAGIVAGFLEQKKAIC